MLSKNNIISKFPGASRKNNTTYHRAMKSSEKLRVRDYLAFIYYFISLIEHFGEGGADCFHW